MNKEKQICSECGAGLREDEAIYFDGRVFCQDCYDDAITACEDWRHAGVVQQYR